MSVSVETSGAAGAKLSVFGLGVEGGGEKSAGSENRISFSVPVRLPDGDKERARKIDKSRDRRMTTGSVAPTDF